jgi:hypothetical protein
MATRSTRAALAALSLSLITLSKAHAEYPHRSMGGALCKDSPFNCADVPNPLPDSIPTARGLRSAITT